MRTVPVAQMNPNTESASREELAPVPARPHSPPARDREGTPTDETRRPGDLSPRRGLLGPGATGMTPPRVDTIVRGGRVVTASDVFEAAVAIKGDKIAAIGPEDLLPSADRIIDAGGRFVLPGLIDCHLHIGA